MRLVATMLLALGMSGEGRAADEGALVISNTAEVRWTHRGEAFSAPSNTVAFTREDNPIVIQPMAPDGSGTPAPAPATLCGGAVLDVAAANDERLRTATQAIEAGQDLYLHIQAPVANRDPASRDTIVVRVETSGGDRETLTVLETGLDTGLFVGVLPTSLSAEALAGGSCSLGVEDGEVATIALMGEGERVLTRISLPVHAAPYSLVFDSEDGSPVDGVRVTLVDAASGAPVAPRSEDGISSWPASLVTGAKVIDGAGRTYAMPPGGFRFPTVDAGRYRILAEPPAGYAATSALPAERLAGVTRPDGREVTILAGSYGGVIDIAATGPVLLDVPLDRPGQGVTVTKTVLRPTAAPGEAVVYSVIVRNPDSQRARRAVVLEDSADQRLRFRPGSLRVDGAAPPVPPVVLADGRGFTLDLGTIARGASREVVYAMVARPDAAPGQAQNRAQTQDAIGRVTQASATVRIERDPIASRMTVIGRVVAGDCTANRAAPGLGGIRIMMEDGSFALTDEEGRYHFDGVTPGTHVVQLARETLPQGSEPVDCERSTRTAGSALSRFVAGQGGQLVAADFRVRLASGADPAASGGVPAPTPTPTPKPAPQRPEVADDVTAAGGGIDWLARADGSPAFLFPGPDHSPRAPALRVVIGHAKSQRVTLLQDGRPVDAVAFDGKAKAEGRDAAISTWRGLPIDNGVTRLVAEVRARDGSLVARLEREVRFSDRPARIELVPELSRLVADGRTSPVLALRVRDRHGRAVHDGVGGEIAIPAPYEALDAIERRQAQALSGDRQGTGGQGASGQGWIVRGDEGLAFVELAPTMVSGPLRLTVPVGEGDTRRVEELEAWMEPGDQPWTLVGLAEGTAGARSIADHMERAGQFDSDLGSNARLAFYAKGRVLGRYLLTVAYDSARQKDDQRLLGAIDPKAYYTVYADGSDRRFDAASREKLYLRIEGRQFYAVYGDFLSGFDQTRLARFQRTMTGAKIEAQAGALHVQAAAARSTQLHRRDEIRGGGITGPYRLSSRRIVANSETVSIETRDRMRTDRVVASRALTRFQDYEIDGLAGTIRLRDPLMSSDAALDPQVLVIEYEVEEGSGGAGAISGAARADLTLGGLRVGASLVSDAQVERAGEGRTSLAGLDARMKIGTDTELRAEVAASRDAAGGGTRGAWLVEAEHHDKRLDVLAYARSVDRDFGVGQLSDAQPGTTRIGIDTRFAVDERLTVDGQVWHENVNGGAAERQAASVGVTWRRKDGTARAGIATVQDSLADGRDAGSTVVEGAVTQQLAHNRVELSAATSVPLGQAGSQALPARHRLGARVAVTRDVRLTGTYEIAQGEGADSSTARVGVDVTPWRGSRLEAGVGQVRGAENGGRSFAAFGASQSLEVSRAVTLEATLDTSRRLSGEGAAQGQAVGPEQSPVTAGYTGLTTLYDEDFTALTLGGTWRSRLWAASLRAEWREGETSDRHGVTFGLLRQLGDGRMLGATLVWARAADLNGGASAVTDASLVLAWRPAASDFALLSRLQYREDRLAIAATGSGDAPWIATDLTNLTDLEIAGPARSRRLLASASLDWSPWTVRDGKLVRRSEASLFLGLRHSLEQLGGLDVAGTSVLAGLDGSIAVLGGVELGGRLTVRYAVSDGMLDYALGPTLAVSPARDLVLVIGYNFVGFVDRDFAAARTTREGLYATARLKFDSGVLDRLERGF